MCPMGLALHHPAVAILLSYVIGGCRINTGLQWMLKMIETAIECGPHSLALQPDNIQEHAIKKFTRRLMAAAATI